MYSLLSEIWGPESVRHSACSRQSWNSNINLRFFNSCSCLILHYPAWYWQELWRISWMYSNYILKPELCLLSPSSRHGWGWGLLPQVAQWVIWLNLHLPQSSGVNRELFPWIHCPLNLSTGRSGPSLWTGSVFPDLVHLELMGNLSLSRRKVGSNPEEKQ